MARPDLLFSPPENVVKENVPECLPQIDVIPLPNGNIIFAIGTTTQTVQDFLTADAHGQDLDIKEIAQKHHWKPSRAKRSVSSALKQFSENGFPFQNVSTDPNEAKYRSTAAQRFINNFISSLEPATYLLAPPKVQKPSRQKNQAHLFDPEYVMGERIPKLTEAQRTAGRRAAGEYYMLSHAMSGKLRNIDQLLPSDPIEYLRLYASYDMIASITVALRYPGFAPEGKERIIYENAILPHERRAFAIEFIVYFLHEAWMNHQNHFQDGINYEKGIKQAVDELKAKLVSQGKGFEVVAWNFKSLFQENPGASGTGNRRGRGNKI